MSIISLEEKKSHFKYSSLDTVSLTARMWVQGYQKNYYCCKTLLLAVFAMLLKMSKPAAVIFGWGLFRKGLSAEN